jgi:hypothetical protein
MAKVNLLSLSADFDKSYWASSYNIFRRAFSESGGFQNTLVDDPEQADLIIVFFSASNPFFPWELFRDKTIRRYRDKCVLFSGNDDELKILPGFYVSARKNVYSNRIFLGGFYPFVAFQEPLHAFPIDSSIRYLFSFVGSSDNASIRKKIGKLNHKRCYVEDVSRHPGNLFGQADEVYEEHKKSYFDSIRLSKFILCPRGKAPSTIRLFETMKAGRVPVIIADQWVAPLEIDWNKFSVFVPEKNIYEIPDILEKEEEYFIDKAKKAREAFDAYFSKASLANTVSRWGALILNENKKFKLRVFGVPTRAFLSEILRWRFWRRGVFSEIKRKLELKIK